MNRAYWGVWGVRWVVLASALFVGLSARECRAASKEECLDAHGRGQDQRDAGHLTSARQTFLACAQSACPPLIQADCARFGEELDRLVPSVSFAARDPAGADLPDTMVYVDDQQVASRLDDGKAYDLDPGKHTVRFLHEGKESIVTVVLNPGDRGRSVVATFGDASPEASRAMPSLPPAPVRARKPVGPLFLVGLGAVAAVTGGVLLGVGLAEVPSSCSIGTRQCEAPPGDPAFDKARRAVGLANFGIGMGAGGAAVLLGGALWYAMEPARVPREVGGIGPWFGDHAGGVRWGGEF